MDSAHRIEDHETVWQRLGGPDAVVDFSPAGHTDVSLTDQEWSMLTCIDGSSTLAEIAESSGRDPGEAARILEGLLSAGVVLVVGTPAVAEAVEAGEAAAEPAAVKPGATEDAAAEAGAAHSSVGDRGEQPAGPPSAERTGLLREFALLDGADPERRPDGSAERPGSPAPAGRRRIQPDPAPEPERRGLLGRFRRP